MCSKYRLHFLKLSFFYNKTGNRILSRFWYSELHDSKAPCWWHLYLNSCGAHILLGTVIFLYRCAHFARHTYTWNFWSTLFVVIYCTTVQSHCFQVCAHTLLRPVLMLYRFSVHLNCKTCPLLQYTPGSDQWELKQDNPHEPHRPITAHIFRHHQDPDPDLEPKDCMLTTSFPFGKGTW